MIRQEVVSSHCTYPVASVGGGVVISIGLLRSLLLHCLPLVLIEHVDGVLQQLQLMRSRENIVLRNTFPPSKDMCQPDSDKHIPLTGSKGNPAYL